jgi:hypothetical protein
MLHGASGPFGQQSCVGTHSAQANAGDPAKNRLASKNVRLKIRRNMIDDLRVGYRLVDRQNTHSFQSIPGT